MLKHFMLLCSLLTLPSQAAAQGEPNKTGVPVEVVATFDVRLAAGLAAGPVDSHPDIEVFFSASRPLP